MSRGNDSSYGKINGSHETLRKVVSRNKILQDVMEKIESQKRAEVRDKQLGERINTFGRNGELKSELRNKGKIDRINLVTFNESSFEDEIIRNNYRAGFVENGNIILISMLDKLTPEQLEAYGRNDYLSGITPDEIPEKLKENVSYTTGYMMASILSDTKSKKGRM